MFEPSKILEQLDGVEHVEEANMATPITAYISLRDIIEEGQESTFGMREKDAIILRLARDLRLALMQLSKLSDAERALAGERLSHGRTKKRLTQLQTDFEQLAGVDKAARAQIDIDIDDGV